MRWDHIPCHTYLMLVGISHSWRVCFLLASLICTLLFFLEHPFSKRAFPKTRFGSIFDWIEVKKYRKSWFGSGIRVLSTLMKSTTFIWKCHEAKELIFTIASSPFLIVITALSKPSWISSAEIIKNPLLRTCKRVIKWSRKWYHLPHTRTRRAPLLIRAFLKLCHLRVSWGKQLQK